jgi:F-type H+-transporting ATPase subunit a
MSDAHHEYSPKPHIEVQDTFTRHVGQSDEYHPWEFFEHFFGEPAKLDLPALFQIGEYKFYLTKYMILQLIAAFLVLLIYFPLSRAIRSGSLPRGRFWNFFEVLLVFVRDVIVRPNFAAHAGPVAHADHAHGGDHSHGDHAKEAKAHGDHAKEAHSHAEQPQQEQLLGDHPADAYAPFFWTLFLFILFCNLLGMIPTMGSPTASIWVTGGLALICYVAIHASVIMRYGVGGLVKSYVPHLDMPSGIVFQALGLGITALLCVLEVVGMIIKAFVLAVRLFANMFAGHLVLANILFFIFAVGKAYGPGALWGSVTVASVIGVVLLSLLELFVAFLQAYVFTFLTALFMGMQLSHASHH